MEKVPPTVSVIIPNYNHAPYLEERIRSVLDQTFGDLEIILLDDCSSDGSRSILEKYRQHPKVSALVINERNSGTTFAQWKRGLALATGRYVWIAESDDSADPCFLETLVGELERTEGSVMAFSGSEIIDSDSVPMKQDWDRYRSGMPAVEVYTSEQLIRRKLLRDNSIYNASMVLFRRDAAPEITEEQLSMRYCGDWDFWYRLALRGSGIEVRRSLNRFRQHQRKVSPEAARMGLTFIEGLPIVLRMAEHLRLTPAQRKSIAGRMLKRIHKIPGLIRDPEIGRLMNHLSPDAVGKRRRLIAFYETDKYLNLTHLLD